MGILEDCGKKTGIHREKTCAETCIGKSLKINTEEEWVDERNRDTRK